MATTLTYRDIVDLPEWRSLSQPVTNGSTTIINTAGLSLAEDQRARDYAHPMVYFQSGTNILSNPSFKACRTIGKIPRIHLISPHRLSSPK